MHVIYLLLFFYIILCLIWGYSHRGARVYDFKMQIYEHFFVLPKYVVEND